MAVKHGSAVSFLVPFNQFASFKTTKSLLSVSSSIYASFPSNLTRRKNHLRIKILKTLTKPLPLTDPSIQIVSPEISRPNDVETELSSTANGDEVGVEVSRVSDCTDTLSRYGIDVGNFSWWSVTRFGVYFLAVFAFQTICTVWVLEYGNSINGDKNSDKGLSVNRKEVLLNGNEKILHCDFGSKTSQLGYLEESKRREKVEEIRSMARDARKKEKYKISENFEDRGREDENVISRARIGIEKEVDARLVKLQKRLNSSREKIPESRVNYLLKSETVDDEVERNDQSVEEGNDTLMFKKKLKYRSSSSERMKKPMGFQGFPSNKRKSGSAVKVAIAEDRDFVLDNAEVKNSGKQECKEIMKTVSGMLKDDEMNLTSVGLKLQPQSDRKKFDIGTKIANTRPSNGAIQETSSVEILKSRNSRDLEVKNSQSFPKGNKETFTSSSMPPVVSSNDSFVEKKSFAQKDKQPNKEIDLWWSNLPYILAIFMHRGSEDEGPGGFFSLKIPSESVDLEDSTYTVAFEDRMDAINFCFLLESFFEDLDDFAAEVVPMATKELEKVAKSYTSYILVVKQGQLQLYAGQPFTDVEMALHDLVKKNEYVICLNPR